MLRRDTARGAGAQLAELVGVDNRHELRRVRAEERDDEARAGAEAGVDLRARIPELEVRSRHHGERAVLEAKAVARPVLDRARRHPEEARLDRVDGLCRREQPFDVGFREVERHESDFLMKLMIPLVSITAH